MPHKTERIPDLPVAQEHLAREEDLTPIIQEMLAGTWQSDISSDEIYTLIDETEEAIARYKEDKVPLPENLPERLDSLWARLKLEQNALVAIVVGEVWREPSFQARRAALIAGEQSFATAFTNAGAIMLNAAQSWFDLHQNIPDSDPLAPLMKRYREIADFRKLTDSNSALGLETEGPDEVRPESSNFDNNSALLVVSGLGTAYDVSTGLARMIITKAREQKIPLTPDQFDATLKRAYSKIGMRLAMMHQTKGISSINAIFDVKNEQTTGGDTKAFFLEQEGAERKYVLKVRSDVLKRLLTVDGEPLWEIEQNGPTTHCPALYNAGGPAVIPQYFDWMHALVANAYRHEYQKIRGGVS